MPSTASKQPSGAASRPVTRTPSRCGTGPVAASATTAGAGGGPTNTTGSRLPSSDHASPASRRHTTYRPRRREMVVTAGALVGLADQGCTPSPPYGGAMRALVQRVSEASVAVAGQVVGAIGPGLCVLVGVTHDDEEGIAARLAAKVANLRVFDDEGGVMNRSLLDTGGGAPPASPIQPLRA